MGALEWMQSLPTSEWITDSNFGFPIMLALHSIGMSVVAGIMIMLDLRLLGFARVAPLAAFQPLMTVAWIGFCINAISGSLMFMADAERLIVNWPFLLKMSCVLLGGIVSAILWRRLRAAGALAAGQSPAAQSQVATAGSNLADTVDGVQAIGEPLAVDRSVQVIAVFSIALWLGAILFGRLIAYIMDHAILHGAIGAR